MIDNIKKKKFTIELNVGQLIGIRYVAMFKANKNRKELKRSKIDAHKLSHTNAVELWTDTFNYIDNVLKTGLTAEEYHSLGLPPLEG